MLHPKVAANVAPRSSCPKATDPSLTHSSVFLRTCSSMGSSTRDDDGAEVVCADPIQGAATGRGGPHGGMLILWLWRLPSQSFLSGKARWLRCYGSPYWITSSARPSSDGGIVRPSALAVLRLITSSNLVGCSTGRSAGLAPLRILST